MKILQQQAAQKGVNNETASEKKREKEALAEKKRREQAKKDELAQLFTPLDIVQPKVPFGVGKLIWAVPFPRLPELSSADLAPQTDLAPNCC